MNTINTTKILSTAFGAENWAPLLTKQVSPRDWVAGMAGKTVLTRKGQEMSLVRDTIFKSQLAMTNIALALRAATELGVMPYAKAVREVRKAHDAIETFAMHFAAQRGENHRELVVAEVGIKVKDGAFADLQSTSDGRYTEEELLNSGFDYEQIEEILEAQAVMSAASNPGFRADAMAEDEGMFRTAIHDANQLWDIELQDIEWAEAVTARVALIDKHWPKANAAWDVLEERLAEHWAAQLDDAEDKELMTRKIDKRAACLTDLQSKPLYARWAINHVTRRVWRDLKAVERKRTQYEERLVELDRAAMAEQRWGANTGYTRPNLGEADEQARVEYLPFEVLVEKEVGRAPQHDRLTVFGKDDAVATASIGMRVGADGMYFGEQVEGDLEHTTREDKDRAWFTYVIERCEHYLDLMRPLYRELRELDLSLTKLWELFNDNGRMPTQPPVYWNRRGFYLTEEEAEAALMVDLAEFKAKLRMADDEAGAAAAEALAVLLDNI